MAEPKAKPNRAASRSAARLAVVQALYQMDMSGIDLNEVVSEFEAHRLGQEIEGDQYFEAEAAFFRDLVEGVVREQRSLDPLIDEQLASKIAVQQVVLCVDTSIGRIGQDRAGDKGIQSVAEQ